MKILFYNHTSQVSGAERVLLLILSRLNRARFEAVLLCRAAGQLQKEAKALNVRCASVDQLHARFTWKVGALIRYFGSFASAIRQVRARVREEVPELIHANSIRAGIVISTATVGMRIPIVWHVHDLLPNHPLSTGIRLFTLLRPPHKIVVVANAAAARFKGKLLSRFPERVKIAVVYNAVDAGPLTPPSGAIRKELRIRNGDRLMGIVGNLSPVKGQLELIRAFAEIRKGIPNLVLLIVGSTLFNRSEGYQEQLAAEVRALRLEHYVRFLGQRNDAPAIMAALDLLVINSRSEAFPLVALEGMSVGVPLLTTAVGGLPELITHKKNGWLIPLGDREKLVNGAKWLLNRPAYRAGLAMAAREHVTRDFPVHKFIAGIEAIYADKVVTKPARALTEPFVALPLETN